MTRRQLLKTMGAAIGFSAAPERRGLWPRNLALADSPGGRPLAGTGPSFNSPIASGSPFNVKLIDVAAPAGLKSVCVSGDPDTKRWIVETTGCGIAFFDYDQDGWPDIFQVSATTLEGFPHGKSPRCHLYHNNRDGTFTDVTAKAGLTRTGWGQGVCIGDYDNDGWDDLFVTYWGQNALYHNNGDGTFTDVTEKACLTQHGPRPRWNNGCCFVDYDKDGHLDLFVANYVDLDLAHTPTAGSGKYCFWKGVPVMCGPRGLPASSNLLYHNNGDGTFTDVAEKSGIRKTPGYYAFTALSGDFDNDGWPDIYVACDSTPSILYHNNHDGTFTDIAIPAGCAFNADGREQAGMGAAAGDYNCDGWLDIYKTNFSDDTCSLYRNNGDGTFTDATFAAGLGFNTRYLGWGCGFADLDNDGWLDVFAAHGHVYPEVERAGVNVPYREPKVVYRNLRDGRFEDVSDRAGSGVAVLRSSRGVAFGDFDNDGDVDIVINNVNDSPTLLRNNVDGKNRWLKVKTVGTRSNRTGLGARVKVVTGEHVQIDEVRSGGSYISQNDLRLHFGMGSAAKADRVEIHWPSGLVDRLKDVETNQVVWVKEGQGLLRTERFPPRAS
ncbi:MAG TPA: CRTAC1 family protein [Terriglobia bacterium]|nr:CRTAC1 family protein [Terriglobia bacterium]